MRTSLTDLHSACLIVTGMPGAGKTSVADLLARRLPKAARLSGDVVAGMVLGGRVWALGEPADEARRQVEPTNRNLAMLANNFASAGFTAVIETVIPDRLQLESLIAALDPAPMLVVLSPGIAMCQSRNATRHEQERWEFAGYEKLEAGMRSEFGELGWWLDTADLTPKQTCNRLCRELRSAPDYLDSRSLRACGTSSSCRPRTDRGDVVQTSMFVAVPAGTSAVGERDQHRDV